MSHLQQTCSFGADPDHNPDPGINFNRILPLQDRASCKNFWNQMPWWKFAVSKCL